MDLLKKVWTERRGTKDAEEECEGPLLPHVEGVACPYASKDKWLLLQVSVHTTISMLLYGSLYWNKKCCYGNTVGK